MSRNVFTIAVAAAAAVLLPLAAAHGVFDDPFADDTSREPALEFEVVASHTTLAPGGTALVAIATTIPDGQHFQDQISLTLDEGSPFALGRAWHPPLHVQKVGDLEFPEFIGEFVAIYELRLGTGVAAGSDPGGFTFTYYPCNDQVCFGVRQIDRELAITIGPSSVENAEFEPFRDKLASLVAVDAPDAAGTKPPAATGKGNKVYVERYGLVGKPNILFFSADGTELKRIVGYRGEDAFYKQVKSVAGGEVEQPKQRSLPLWLGLALVGGLLAAFSPCVYPMIPITIGFLADQAGPKFGRNLAMTLALGAGVVLPFAVIGAFIGALKDTLYGLTSSPVYILILDAVLIALTASMLGAFDIQLPAALRNKAAGGRNTVGLVGAFIIGLVVVPLAFACTAPALGLIIPFIVGKAIGTAMLVMVVFGLGLAAPFLAAGMFAGALTAMPRAGAWMLGIKKIFALLLIGVIFYVSRPLTQTFPHATGMLAGVAFVAIAVALGVFRKHLGSAFNRGVTVVALVLGVYFAVGTVLVEAGKVKAFPLHSVVRYPDVGESAIEWRHDLDAAFDEAARDDKLVMAYFSGNNCLACTEYDVRIWPKPEAADALRDFVPVKINVDE